MKWGAGLLVITFLALKDVTDSSPYELKGIVPQKCLHCICMVESKCKPIGCVPDKGSLSCGYYQIKFAYWEDCYRPKPRGGCSNDKDCWQKCAKDLNCATQCVNSYMSRYAKMPGCHHDCESYARLHNGGPYGCTNPKTIPYWKKVKACLGDSDGDVEEFVFTVNEPKDGTYGKPI